MGVLRRWALLAALLASLACLASAATFEQKLAFVYDIAPKVRIAGSGFDALDASTLELSFTPTLKAGEDYKLDVFSSTVLVLSLQPDKKWVSLDPGAPPMPLYLSSAKSGDDSLLDDSVQIATIVAAPSVDVSAKNIYMEVTPKLAVSGSNFNVKNTQLFFDPPLQEGTVIQKQVMNSTQIVLIKIFKYEPANVWTPEPGPLKVVAIDTGGGRLSLNPDDGGVVIAEVQADLTGHGITVQNHESTNIYQSTKSLQITGQGFVDDVKVRFANALRGGGTNFTITDAQPTQLTLELQEGSTWRKNPAALPGPLVLLAANAGDGWVPLGPTSAKAGRKVATVYEDPSIAPSDVELYRTHTHELSIVGTGFSKQNNPVLDFEPALESSSISVDVVDRTMIRLSLSGASAQWATTENLGPLTIKGMDTGAGMIVFDAPVTVATVVSDSDVHESGVEVFPAYDHAKYQSSKDPLMIHGAGFKDEPVLNFDPPIWSGKNYTLTVVSEDELKLDLVEGSKWSPKAGALMLKGINVGDGDVEIAGGKGVKVATILEDPVVKAGEMQIYTTHTKHFPVRGSGFFAELDGASKPPSIVIDGISSANYKIQDTWKNGVMNLQLLEGKSWATVPPGGMTPLKLMSIDTGAGVISYPAGVEIAVVREDSSSNLCEDSCSFANDGMCDEPAVAFGSGGGGGNYDSYSSDSMGYNPYGLGWGYDDDANSFLDTNDYSNMYRYVGYSTTFQYYGMTMSDDGFFNGMSPCEVGTDCSDCGVQVVMDGTCTNTCQHSRDGYCDDPRSNGVCPSGTDCQDCGPWGEGQSNFTETSFYQSSSWFEDDDNWDYLWDDEGLLYGQEMNAQPVYKRDWNDHEVINKEAAGASTIFVDVLWAMVVLVGCSMSLGGCMVAYRHFKAGGGGAPMYLPVQAAEEVELSRRGAGTEQTPDVVRIG